MLKINIYNIKIQKKSKCTLEEHSQTYISQEITERKIAAYKYNVCFEVMHVVQKGRQAHTTQNLAIQTQQTRQVYNTLGARPMIMHREPIGSNMLRNKMYHWKRLNYRMYKLVSK